MKFKTPILASKIFGKNKKKKKDRVDHEQKTNLFDSLKRVFTLTQSQIPFFIRLINPFVSLLFPTTNAPQDPKTSRWLWDLKERSRQRRRTENYREIMHMQQKIAEPLAKLDHEDETAAARENQV